MAATRQQCPSLLPAEWWNSLWWKRWPIKHRFHWWHNRKNGFFFQDCPQTPVYPQWWIFIGSPWGRRLPDTLWRTWFADNLVKTETAVLLWPSCFSVGRHNVVGCPAAWKEKEGNIYRSELILMLKECVMHHASAFGSYSVVQVKEEKKYNIVSLSCSKPLPCQMLLY